MFRRQGYNNPRTEIVRHFENLIRKIFSRIFKLKYVPRYLQKFLLLYTIETATISDSLLATYISFYNSVSCLYMSEE